MLENDKYEIFCNEYIVDFNGSRAAISAGYAEASARITASKLLTNANIQSRIAELMQERSSKAQIDASYVLNRLLEIDQMDVLDILNDDMSLKRVSEWPKVWRQYLSGFELAEMFSGKGDDREAIGVLKKIKWPDKVKNLELLGRHVDVKAFEKESAPITGVIHIMPVPTASSVEDWEKAAAVVQKNNAQ